VPKENREPKEDRKEGPTQRKKKLTSGLLVITGLCGNMKILNRRYWREIPLCDYLKDSRVDGIVVTFTTSYDLPGILMFNY